MLEYYHISSSKYASILLYQVKYKTAALIAIVKSSKGCSIRFVESTRKPCHPHRSAQRPHRRISKIIRKERSGCW
jgi:hypothetical protein